MEKHQISISIFRYGWLWIMGMFSCFQVMKRLLRGLHVIKRMLKFQLRSYFSANPLILIITNSSLTLRFSILILIARVTKIFLSNENQTLGRPSGDSGKLSRTRREVEHKNLKRHILKNYKISGRIVRA